MTITTPRALIHIQLIKYAKSYEELDTTTHFAAGYLLASRECGEITHEQFSSLRIIKEQAYSARTLELTNPAPTAKNTTGDHILRWIRMTHPKRQSVSYGAANEDMNHGLSTR